MQRNRLIGLIAGFAVLAGPAQETAMSDDRAWDGPPTFSVASPGVVATNQTKPFPDFEIQTFYLGTGRRLQTVKASLGRHIEDVGIHVFDPVDWEAAVPRGAQLFSVTAGVGAGVVQQFWVGWIKDGHAHLEALTEERPVTAALAPDESVIFPAVMDGAGAASLFSWKPAGEGVALSQRLLAKKGAATRTVVEIPGQPVVSRMSAVPGRPRCAVVGWVERAATSSVVGVALVEGGRAKLWRSPPLVGMSPIREQRIGVWASAADRLEVTAALTGKGGYGLARFSVRTGESKGAVRTAELSLRPGEVARAAIDYSGTFDEPESSEYFLLKDGSLLGQRSGHEGLAIVRRSVPLESPLPIIADYWISQKADGSPAFELLRPR